MVEYQEDLDYKQINYEADRAWEQKRKGNASSSNEDSRGYLAFGEDIFQMFKTISADKVKPILLLSCFAINSNYIRL
jgi:hypothetical protein